MWRVNKLIERANELVEYPGRRRRVSQVSGVIVGLILLIRPVAAQSAFEEAAEIACDGALGQAIFLGFGLLTLILILAGLAQIAIGFITMGGGGGGMGGQRRRKTILNGALTLAGGLFLGSMSAFLDYLGVNVDNCLDGSILIIMPLFM